nr:MAG TPA_asm: hypothetical protein [Caudoviricetes sp.]
MKKLKEKLHKWVDYIFQKCYDLIILNMQRR